MPAPTLKQIREGIKTRLDTIGDDVQTSAYRLGDPTPPCVFVLGPDETQYHQAMQNGHDSWALTVMAFAGATESIGAQQLLDQFIAAVGAKSVKRAIESDRTLAGVVNDASVRSCSGYREYEVNGVAVLGAEWRVLVEADGA